MVIVDGIVTLEGVLRVEGNVILDGIEGGYTYNKSRRVGIATRLKKKSH